MTWCILIYTAKTTVDCARRSFWILLLVIPQLPSSAKKCIFSGTMAAHLHKHSFSLSGPKFLHNYSICKGSVSISRRNSFIFSPNDLHDRSIRPVIHSKLDLKVKVLTSLLLWIPILILGFSFEKHTKEGLIYGRKMPT